MRKFLLTLSAIFLLLVSGLAQKRTITGTVTDEKGSPIPNATVQVKGTSIGTTTNSNGDYTLSVSQNSKILVFSSVNAETQEISINGQSLINVNLKTTSGVLTEVVVTAYGTTKKKAFTGTASTVKSDEVKDLQVSSIGNLLQGKASGVLVLNDNGQPGENPEIRIRGIGSITSDASPLYVVDGAPYGGNINNINQNDIESFTVLKDASSTALYGSRAANGVILITTKSGRGKPRVNLSAVTGFSTRAVNDYPYVNSQQMYELAWEALKNEGTLNPALVGNSGAVSPQDYASQGVVDLLVYNPFGVPQPVGNDGKLVSGAKSLWNQNWEDALLRTGIRNDFDLSISGGSDKTKYYFSGGYLDDQGLPIESDFKRYTGRLNVTTKVNDWLDAGMNTNVAFSTQNYPLQGGSAYSNIVGWIRNVSSIYPEFVLDPVTGQPILDANGKKQYDYGNNGPLNRPIFNPGNPAGTTSQNPTTYDRLTTSVNGFADAQIVKGLKFRTQYALDLYQIQSNTYYNPFVGDGAAYHGRSDKSRNQASTQTFTNTLTYDKNFGEHHINLLGGMEAYRYHQSIVEAEARGFTFPGATELSYGSTPYTATSTSYDDRLVSYFSRLNYDYNEKYHLSLSLRTDGSSRFADSSRWGVFYSIGGAWNINKENILSGIRSLSELKLRASYGTTGNRSLPGYFPYLGTYSAGANIADYSGSIISALGNGSLHWETQKTLDLGVDFGLFKNRITGSFTYFERNSQDLLYYRPLPPSVGINGINDNIAKVSNKGVEIDLTTQNIVTQNFTWTTSINATHIKNKIVSLPGEQFDGPGYSNLKVGQSLNNFYIREYAGVDASDGRPMWYMDVKDANDKVTGRTVTKTWSAGTRYYKGTSLPDWTGGFTSTFSYKNIDLTVFIYGSIGGKVYDADYAGLMYSSTGIQPGYQWSVDVLNRWQSPSNPGDGRTPRLTSTTDDQGNSTSTRFLYDGSYARIRNITLGYSFPKDLLSKINFSNARFYVDFQNPFTFFGRKGLDPEEGLQGITDNTSSVYKTISVGVNIGF
jgi:TonB-linked SusC/RagA family outer membrane protein